MRTNIYLVRHAHSVYTSDELNRPLSERGFKDAERVTKLLSGENITHIVSSPYKRAVQTVECIAKLYKLNILLEDGFKERKLANSSVDNFNETVYKAWKNIDFSLPGGESSFNAQKRGIEALNKIIEKFCGGNIVIGTHGHIMVLIMNFFDHKYNYDFWKNLNMPDIYKLSFENQNLIRVLHIWADN